MFGLPLHLLVAFSIIAVGVAIVAAVTASRLMPGRSIVQQRVHALSTQSVMAPATALLDGASAAPRTPLLGKSFKQMSTVERRLAHAGYRSADAARLFVGAQIVLPVVVVAIVLLVIGVQEKTAWIGAGIGALLGYFTPGFVVDHKITERRRQMKNGLPDVLDLLIVCLEAGSSLDQAVVKATEELDLAYPALCEELRVLTTETRAGKPRLEAFRNLAQRTKVDDIRALVGMLTQTDRFGTSVSQALRTLAESMRTERQQVAEEKANKLGVKLVFPLALCLFPAFFVVALAPALISLIKALRGTLH